MAPVRIISTQASHWVTLPRSAVMVTPVPVSIATHLAARTAAHNRVSSASATSASVAVCSSVNHSTAAVSASTP